MYLNLDARELVDRFCASMAQTMPLEISVLAFYAKQDLAHGYQYANELAKEDENEYPGFSTAVDIIKDWSDDNIEDLIEDEMKIDRRHLIRGLFGKHLTEHL